MLCLTSEEKVWQEAHSQLGEFFPVFPLDKGNGDDVYFVDPCLEILNYSVESFDYLDFFSHCPWCRSIDIRLSFFKSPAWAWVAHVGRSGWVVKCAGCQEDLLFDVVAMS